MIVAFATDENARLKSTKRTGEDKMRMTEVEERADQLSMGASSRIVEKTLMEMCNRQSDILSLLNPVLPLCIFIGFAKHLNELQVNQIGSIAEDGRWGTLMVIEHLYF